MCGENTAVVCVALSLAGSPPRVWGKQLGGGDKAQDEIYDGERIGNVRGLRLEIGPLHNRAQDERKQCQHVDPYGFTFVPWFHH